MRYGPEGYAHPIRLVIAMTLFMPLTANMMAWVWVILGGMLVEDWKRLKRTLRGANYDGT